MTIPGVSCRTRSTSAAALRLVVLLLIVFISGCATGDSATNDEPGSDRTALVVKATAARGPAKTPPTPTTAVMSTRATAEAPPTTVAPFAEGFRLPEDFVLPTTLPPVVSTSTTTTSAPAPTPAPAPNTPLAPAPTVPKVASDPSSLYQGVLGRLDLFEQVASPAAPAPATRAGTAPLTGLASPNLSRAPIVVKIDNSANARPQTGLEAADIIIEEEVEWGITRLAAIFHSASADVGPVRSGRTTDVSYLSALGNPVLAYSGANQITEDILLAQQRVQNLGANRFGGYWRSSGRSAPHNLYTSTDALWAAAAAAATPAQFAYRSADTESAGSATTGADIGFPSLRVGWTWSGTSWLRTQGGSAHLMSSGTQLEAANVVVVEVAEIPTGLKDSAGGVVPEFVFVGTGPVTVLSDGKVVRGSWTRPSLADVATITRPDGRIIELTPGVTWIEIVTSGALTVR